VTFVADTVFVFVHVEAGTAAENPSQVLLVGVRVECDCHCCDNASGLAKKHHNRPHIESYWSENPEGADD